MMNFIRVAILVLPLMYSQSVFAQHSEADSTQSGNITLDEVVVSVNKIEESKKQLHNRCRLSWPDTCNGFRHNRPPDLIATSESVFVQKSQAGGGSITSRGFEASRTLFVVDWVRMNNLIYRSGHLQNGMTTDNNSLEKIEVLFGPSSTIYGSDALGGVVHLCTQKPLLRQAGQNAIKLNYLSRYGSVNNEFSNHFDFNYGSKKLAS